MSRTTKTEYYIHYSHPTYGSDRIGCVFHTKKGAYREIAAIRKNAEAEGYCEWVGSTETGLWVCDQDGEIRE